MFFGVTCSTNDSNFWKQALPDSIETCCSNINLQSVSKPAGLYGIKGFPYWLCIVLNTVFFSIKKGDGLLHKI